MDTDSVYLDYNATTPLDPEVGKAIKQSIDDDWANPSSGYQSGKKAKLKVDEARIRIAKMISPNQQSIDPEREITFTSGGTEANHLALYSAVQLYKEWFSTKMEDSATPAKTDSPIINQSIPHILTTNIEHVAVELPLRKWQEDGLLEVTFVEVEKSDGRVNVDRVMSCIQPNTCLVTVMFANNETGVIQPICEIARMLQNENMRRRSQKLFSILCHSDAAQVFGKVPLEVNDESFPVDYLTICGHKFYGPRIGALYHRKDTCEVRPVFHGGGQEFHRRPGTENTPMIVGLGEAAYQVC